MSKTITGKIAYAKRLNNSVNGNPRFIVAIRNDEGVEEFYTSSDSACSYSVENYFRSGETITAQLTRAGRISTIKAA